MRPSRPPAHGAAVRAACLLALALACKGKEEAPAETTKSVVAANTVTASIEPFTHTVAALGTVVSRPGRFAALSAPSPTRITKVHVAAGDRVSAGSSLVEFEQVGFNAAASAADASLTAAQRNYERAQRLQPDPDGSDPAIAEPRNDAERAATTMRGISPGLP